MRRFWYAKYALTLLALTALTFHLLHTGTDISENKIFVSVPIAPNDNDVRTGYSFTKSNNYLLRKLSQGIALPPQWIVLPGNVTVHEGQQQQSIDFTYLIRADTICEDYDDSKNRLAIFVASSPNHSAQRNAIRETWGLKFLQRAYNYRVVFLLGYQDNNKTRSRVMRERYRYGDIVQVNMTDSFRNLGLKSIVGLHWSRNFCHQADFVMKTDDDILVHVPNLISSLHSFKSTDSLLMCHENRQRKILRTKMLHESMPANYNKYVVSENELPGVYYPPYCSGMAYVFSRTVRDRLLEASLQTPTFFIEDVFLTGFCRHKAGIVIKPHPGITLRPPINFHQASCSFRDGRVTSQEVKAHELKQLWEELNTQGFFCPQLVGYARQKLDTPKNNKLLVNE